MKTRRLSEAVRQSGVALILVVFAVSAAAVLGCALLAAGSLQAQAGGNAVTGAAAENLAQSGVNLALWHLQDSGGDWTGISGVTIGSSPGTIDISCTRIGSGNAYQITSTARIGTLQRSATAQIELETPMVITADDPSWLSKLLGGVLKVLGNLVNAVLTGHFGPLADPDQLTQMPVGAQQLYSPLSGSYGQSGAGQVFWVDGDATLESDLVIRGRLIVTGNLTINGTGIRITRTDGQLITQDKRPAAVVVGGMLISNPDSQATIDGGVWVNKRIDLNAGLDIYGPLMIGEGGIKDYYDGKVKVRPLMKVISRQ